MYYILKKFFSFFFLSKASIVQYHELPYEKRLNLTPTSFQRLFNASSLILQYFYHVEFDCVQGKPIIQPMLIEVSEEHNLHAVVTSYKGKPKIHLGTRAYCDILMVKIEGGGYTLSPPKERGRAIPVVFFQELGDIYDRVQKAWEEITN